jgi:hypothetical protein
VAHRRRHGLALRATNSFKAPTHFKLTDLLKKFDKTSAPPQGLRQGLGRSHQVRHRQAPRRSLEFRSSPACGSRIFNYDFRRTEMHHPVCDADGRNLLLRLQHRHRWRNIIEKMPHRDAQQGYEDHGRRPSPATSPCCCRRPNTR